MSCLPSALQTSLRSAMKEIAKWRETMVVVQMAKFETAQLQHNAHSAQSG